MAVATSKQAIQASDIINQRLKKATLKIGDIIIPALVLVVLVILSVFIFIPMIESTMEFRSQSKDINDKMDTLQNVEQSLNTIDDTSLQADLIVAKKVIPETLKVSDFVYYINSAASQNSLTADSLTAGDVKIISGENEYTYGVNGPLSYTGTFENILSFLDELQTASPYIISVEGISLREASDGGWTLSITVTGYYIPASTQALNLYEPFILYTKYEDIVSALRDKASKLSD